MLQIGDTFEQDGVTYVVKGKDGAGRPLSSCKPEDVEQYKKKETPEEDKKNDIPAAGELKQEELPFVTVPNPGEEKKKGSKKA